MFSFFKSKKPSPDQTPNEPIPGPVQSPPREDSFIFIERRPIPSSSGGSATDDRNSRGPAGESSVSSGGAVGPAGPGTPAATSTVMRHRSEEKVGHYALHGVPFRLGTEIDPSYADPEMTRLQVTEILTFIGRASAMELDSPVDYDFALERSVLLE